MDDWDSLAKDLASAEDVKFFVSADSWDEGGRVSKPEPVTLDMLKSALKPGQCVFRDLTGDCVYVGLVAEFSVDIRRESNSFENSFRKYIPGVRSSEAILCVWLTESSFSEAQKVNNYVSVKEKAEVKNSNPFELMAQNLDIDWESEDERV